MFIEMFIGTSYNYLSSLHIALGENRLKKLGDKHVDVVRTFLL